MPVLVRASIAEIKHHDKKCLGEERVYFILQYTSYSRHCLGKARQELKQRPGRSDAYWITQEGLLSLLSYSIREQKSRDGITHSQLSPPTSIISQESILLVSLVGDIFSIEIPSSKMTLVPGKLTETSQTAAHFPSV